MFESLKKIFGLQKSDNHKVVVEQEQLPQYHPEVVVEEFKPESYRLANVSSPIEKPKSEIHHPTTRQEEDMQSRDMSIRRDNRMPPSHHKVVNSESRVDYSTIYEEGKRYHYRGIRRNNRMPPSHQKVVNVDEPVEKIKVVSVVNPPSGAIEIPPPSRVRNVHNTSLHGSSRYATRMRLASTLRKREEAGETHEKMVQRQAPHGRQGH